MNNNHISVGKLGEDMAENYLKGKKYKIIDRNYKRKWGEIDLITKAPDKTLVFIEVKTLNKDFLEAGAENLSPENNLTFSKLKKLQRTALAYANSHDNLIDKTRGWRIDLIAIKLTNSQESCDIKHYENIFL